MAESFQNFTRLGERRFRKKVLPRPWTVTLNRRKKEKPVSLLFFFFMFVSVKVAKFEIFSVEFNSYLYKTNGPASTQKLNYLHLHFERGDSQHKDIPISTPSKPPYRAFEIFHLKLYI